MIVVFLQQRITHALLHPAETSKNSDICDFLKVSDMGKKYCTQWRINNLNDTSQFSEDIMEIYI